MMSGGHNSSMEPARERAPETVALAGLVALAVAMGIGRFAFTPILPMMQHDRGLSVTAGSWLASANYLGYLAGAAIDVEGLPESDMRRRLPRFLPEQMKQNARLNDALQEHAATRRCTPAQLSLTWLLAKGPHIVPIPGTKRRTYLDENAAAADMALGADEVARLDAIFGFDEVAGARYPDDLMRLIDTSE